MRYLAFLLLAFLAPAAPAIQPLQVKACLLDPVGMVLGSSCQFDNPTMPDSLLVGVGAMGGYYPAWCAALTDSQKNSWFCANEVGYINGTPIWYVLNSAGGQETIYFPPNVGAYVIIAEYPPATGFQGIAFGTYQNQNLDECVNGQDCYIGWTFPIETDEPCELFLTWGTYGGLVTPTAGPNFTMRATSADNLFFLEDQTTTVPGFYIGTAKWLYGNHWLMQAAAFKMGGCKP